MRTVRSLHRGRRLVIQRLAAGSSPPGRERSPSGRPIGCTKLASTASLSGPVSSTELAGRADLDKSATSKALAGLLAKGLVDRTQRTADRRFTQLVLSTKGRELHDRILPVVEGINRRLLSALSEAEVAQLDGMLDRMQQQADQLWVEAEEDLPRADRRHGGTRPER